MVVSKLPSMYKNEIFYTIMHTTVAVLSLPKKEKKMWVPWDNSLDKFLTGTLKTKIWPGYYVCNHQDSGAYLPKKAFLWHESKLPCEKHIHFEYLDSDLPQYQSKFWEPTWLTFTFECWIETSFYWRKRVTAFKSSSTLQIFTTELRSNCSLSSYWYDDWL